MKNKPKLKYIAILGHFDDGKTRQIFIKKKTEGMVLSTILAVEEKLTVSEDPIESIVIK